METDGRQFNVIDFISEYVYSLDYDNETRDKIKKSLHKLYQNVIEKEKEDKEI
jgi:hypothetical protein